MFGKKLYVILFAFMSFVFTQKCVEASELFDNVLSSVTEELKKVEDGAVGIGVMYETSPYKGADDEVMPVPMVMGEYKNFFIEGTEFGYKIIKNDDWELSAILGPRMDGYEASDSTDLAGMKERKNSFDGGAKLEWDAKIFELEVSVLADLANNHQGQEVEFELSKEFLGGFLTPYVGVTWLSKDLANYYYGVRSSEARSGRPAYTADSSFNPAAGVRIVYPINEKWAIFSDFEYEILDSNIKDSPIVDQDGLFSSMFGVVYQF